MNRKTESFWAFSLSVYRQASVSDACLSLQDEYGVDVNLLLYCCWAGLSAPALDEETFRRAHRLSTAWSEAVVRPLRATRRSMKSDCHEIGVDFDQCMALRERIKKDELQAEKLQQLALEKLVLADASSEATPAGRQAVMANLERYFAALGVEWNDDVRERVSVILGAALGPATES